MHFYKNSQLPVSVAITPGQIAKNDCFDQVNRRFERLHESIWHARIFIVRQRITLQNSNDYLRQIDCLGFAGSVAKRNAGCQDPAHCLSGFLSKAGSFLPGFFFPCAPARNRFALRRRSLLPKAFAPAATWTCLCSRSSRTGGWLHSRYRETSASPYQKEGMIARPRSEHLIFLSVGRSGRQLRDSRSYAMVLGDLRRCKTAFSYRASRNYLWCWGGYATSHNNPLSHARGQSLPDSARRRVCALY